MRTCPRCTCTSLVCTGSNMYRCVKCKWTGANPNAALQRNKSAPEESGYFDDDELRVTQDYSLCHRSPDD